jgi:hypothetical protein
MGQRWKVVTLQLVPKLKLVTSETDMKRRDGLQEQILQHSLLNI